MKDKPEESARRLDCARGAHGKIEIQLCKALLEDFMYVIYTVLPEKGDRSVVNRACGSPDDLNKAVDEILGLMREGAAVSGITLESRNWIQYIDTVEELEVEAAYAAGDDGSFDEFDELVRRNAKYVCWYHNDLATDLYNTVGPDELLHLISVASEFCKEV